MKKIMLILLVLMSRLSWAGDEVIGYWKTIDDETHTAKSIVRIYEYDGKYYGRVVELFQNKQAVAKLPDKPLIKGLDIIWDLKKDKNRYSDGEILDPKKGKVYGCELWRDGENLIVRGKIAFLGRNQTWEPVIGFKSEEDQTFIPKKPRLK